MCDTLVAVGNSTADGSVIFGKNSDRPSNEIQLITYSPAKTYPKGEELKCTYISIPQVSETAAIILSQPSWMWGAEMGCSEHGVVIGNEAVYTHEPIRSKGLLGMDLLRLGLERGRTALDALNIITKLLEQYHQGGGCAQDDSSWSYHNSFLIADNNEAYVLEAADDWWITEKVKDVRSISNRISIRGKGDSRRKGIIDHAIQKNYCKDDDEFDFAVTFSGDYYSDEVNPYSRGGKSSLMLNKYKEEITPQIMMEFLREHEAGICMHGGFESTGSQVSSLNNQKQCSVHWFTGTTLPCLSVYKPYVFPVQDERVLSTGPYKKIDYNWFWIRHSKYIQKYTGYFNKSDKIILQSRLNALENEMINDVTQYMNDYCASQHDFFKVRMNKLNNDIWDKTEDLIQEN